MNIWTSKLKFGSKNQHPVLNNLKYKNTPATLILSSSSFFYKWHMKRIKGKRLWTLHFTFTCYTDMIFYFFKQKETFSDLSFGNRCHDVAQVWTNGFTSSEPCLVQFWHQILQAFFFSFCPKQLSSKGALGKSINIHNTRFLI